MPWARTNGARPTIPEILKHARQDGGEHVTVDGAWSIVGGELTPRGHAGTRGQPVRGPFAGITVRVPEDPQNHDQHERDREHGQCQQRPREHAAFDEQEHDHGEDQGEHAHHRPHTRHEMAFLVGQAFQQMRVPAQPYARLGRFESFPHVHDLAAVVRVLFHTSMTLRRLSAFSSSRSYERPPSHRLVMIPVPSGRPPHHRSVRTGGSRLSRPGRPDGGTIRTASARRQEDSTQGQRTAQPPSAVVLHQST